MQYVVAIAAHVCLQMLALLQFDTRRHRLLRTIIQDVLPEMKKTRAQQ